MGHPLDDARAKLARAQTHFQELDAEIRDFLGLDPYPITPERHPKERGYVLRVHIREEIPHPRWSLLAGDCVHNARSALDHLAWRMAGADPADTVTQFPLFDDPSLYKRFGGRMMSRLSGRRHVAFVKWHQPYRRGDAERVDLLWMLQTFDVADKHKLLVPVAAVMVEAELSVHVPPRTHARIKQELRPGPFVDGAEIGQLVVAETTSVDTGEPTDAKVQVDADHIFEVALHNPVIGRLVPHRALAEAIACVGGVLDSAERLKLV